MASIILTTNERQLILEALEAQQNNLQDQSKSKEHEPPTLHRCQVKANLINDLKTRVLKS